MTRCSYNIVCCHFLRYYLNLVLVDEEERRYFKQQEITLWRKAERPRKPYSLGGGSGPLPLQHAMARHMGGEYPSQNIRTAPTPSNPNTPIVGDPAYGHLGGGDGQFSTETDEQNSDQVRAFATRSVFFFVLENFRLLCNEGKVMTSLMDNLTCVYRR